jgi:hypothetical protein
MNKKFNAMLKISYATVCMNRLHHLKLTLPKNIHDNLNDGNVEFVLLDYNSSDGLEDWIHTEMNEYISAGLLSYYRTPVPQYFNRSHSRNIMFRLATGEIICNVDADNYTGKGFTQYIRKQFDNNTNIFLNADMTGRLYQAKGAFGRFVARKEDFIEVGGYDETMTCYGFEDCDLVNRLKLLGKREVVIEDIQFLDHIHHGNEERFKNEFTFLQLDSLYVNYISPVQTEFLFLYKNGDFDIPILEDTFNANASSYYNLVTAKPERFQFNFTNNTRAQGKWMTTDESVMLCFEDGKQRRLRINHPAKNIMVDESDKTFYNIDNKTMIEEAIFAYSQIINRTKMNHNTEGSRVVVNAAGFGKGEVFKNFNYNSPLSLQ